MKYCVWFLFSLLIACSSDRKEDPVKFFASSIGKIKPTVRLFDFRCVRVNPKEKTRWVAFDVGSNDWEGYIKENQLREVKFAGDAFALASGQSHLETGFEGYLDGDFVKYEGGRRTGRNGYYFVRRVRDYMRVVYLEREY